MLDPDMKTSVQPEERPQRLCSEIQLFDLCDLESCRSKDGRFCTDTALLERFEKIADAELRVPVSLHLDEDDDEADEAGGYGGYDEEIDNAIGDDDVVREDDDF